MQRITYDQMVAIAHEHWCGVYSVRKYDDEWTWRVTLHAVDGPVHRHGAITGVLMCKCCTRLCEACQVDWTKWTDWGPYRPRPAAITEEVMRSQMELIIDTCRKRHQEEASDD